MSAETKPYAQVVERLSMLRKSLPSDEQAALDELLGIMVEDEVEGHMIAKMQVQKRNQLQIDRKSETYLLR